MATDKRAILYLFDRISEPLYIPKGNGDVVFELPESYTARGLREMNVLVKAKNSAKIIRVHNITIPDLTLPERLPRYRGFSIFIPEHQKMAVQLIKIFMAMETYDDLLSVAAYCRESLNLDLFVYALSVALLHRPDTKDLQIPALCEIFPDKFHHSAVIFEARQEAYVASPDTVSVEVPPDYTVMDINVEQFLAYWREDIGINLHYWHWHLVYPFTGPINIVQKDRRGEHFYYMHQQILARYNCERVSNQLGLVKCLNLREPIPEFYLSKLQCLGIINAWPGRPRGLVLKDINVQLETGRFTLEIMDLERWHERILSAIHLGFVVNTTGEKIPLNNKDGIDMLGNLIEASILSVNSDFYGSLHNDGHNAISLIHDPESYHLENPGVMGDIAIAMRDPVFYRWHAYIDYLFQEHKNILLPYRKEELWFPNIEVKNIIVTSRKQIDNLFTYWEKSTVDLSHGISFMPGVQTLVKYQHLDHCEFTYRITVKNNSDIPKRGTIRIFMGPIQDYYGTPYTFKEAKNLMIEMDKFFVTIFPGESTITRKSTESSIIVSGLNTFPDITKGEPSKVNDSCRCGWPKHLLLPKGTENGLFMSLFVMVSNDKEDTIKPEVGPSHTTECKETANYCGLRDNKYPDARAMGYPFDRQADEGVKTLRQFIKYENMNVTRISIRFLEKKPSIIS